MYRYLRTLTKSSIVRRYAQGSIILYQGEVPRSVCVLLEGVVRVYKISSQGDEQIVTFHVAGEFFPLAWIFDKSPSTVFFYEALSDCKVALVSKESFVEQMTTDEGCRKSLIDYLATNYTAFLMRINGLEQSKARDKLIYTLHFLVQRYGKMSAKGKISVIPIALTHQTLASLVGLTRETTAAEISLMKKQGVVSYSHQCYRVNVQKLQKIMGEDSFNEVVI